MANPTVSIDITARLDGLRAELAKIPDIGGKAARDLSSQLSKEIKAATAAQKAATAQAQALSRATEEVGGSANKALKAFGPLGGVLAKLDPTAGSLSSTIAGLTSSVEGFEAAGSAGLAVLAPLALALAAGAAAYTYYSGEADRAASLQATYASATQSLIPTVRALELAQLDLAEALGTVTEAEAKQERTRIKAREAMQAFGDAQKKEREEIRKSTDSAEMWLDVIKNPAVEYAADAVFGFSATIATNRQRLDVLNQALVTEATNQKDLRETVNASTVAQSENTKGKNAATSAARRKAEADRLAAEETRREEAAEKSLTAQIEGHQAALEKIRAITEAATASSLDGADAVYAKEAERLRQLDEEYTKALTLAANDEQRVQAKQANDAAIIAIHKQTANEIADIDLALAAKQQQLQEFRVNTASSIAGSIESIAQTMANRIGETDKQAALVAFGVAKGAAAAQAAINTALAVSNALAQPGVPYPVAVAMAVAAGIAGVAEEAVILSEPAPSFGDTPAPMRMAGGGNVRLAGGDYFAAAQSPQDLQRQVGALDPFAGSTDGGGMYTVIGSRAFGRFIRDDVRERTPLSRVLQTRRNRPLGRR